MKLRSILSAFLLVAGISGLAQIPPVIVPSNIRMPKDSLTVNLVLDALNGFLKEKEKPNSENAYVLKEELLETSVLLDEIKEIEKSSKFKDQNFYKAYLTNIVALDSTDYLIQFSYFGIQENSPLLRASFKVLAKKENSKFLIHSPLKYTTRGWKKKKEGNTTIYYLNTFDKLKTQNYFKTIGKYDKKLKIDGSPEIFYSCSGYSEVLSLIGVDYKSDYSGRNKGTLSADENGTGLRVDGTLFPADGEFDPHDLWHSRVRKVIPPGSINRPVDEGTAYLYGGSWGFDWNEIFRRFKKFADVTPDVDWLALYNESINFNKDPERPLNVDFVINALFAEKIEKEKGFQAVMELLTCGKKEKDNENYFRALEKITGVRKTDFNKTVNEMIRAKQPLQD